MSPWPAACNAMETLLVHSSHLGRAVQVDPMKLILKAPGTKRLKQKYDKLLTLCFQVQLAPLHLGKGGGCDTILAGLKDAGVELFGGKRAATAGPVLCLPK